MQLAAGAKLHGFTVKEVREIPEIKAVMYRMEFDKNGADLVWLDRADDNKTFGICFKTVPEDSTGIFHIIEHSVLNGSEKYPVKEPFVELLKSSLQTFLNAMTGSDLTIYPVASRNDQDFQNLMDVYLDAVFHPLTLKDPHAFRQEGWHYELDDPDGELLINGVVYNEMQGAMSNPDEVLEMAIAGGLFPDTCYRFNSGGDPEHIPDLTYEQYVKSHKRFYHPSNSRIFLDGEIDLDATLSRIESYLKPYDRITPNSEIAVQAPVTPPEITAEYEIGEDEDENSKVILAEGWVIGLYNDRVKNLASEVLGELLCGSNESPLKQAILNAGLAQDVSMHTSGGLQPYLTLTVRNTSLDKKDEVWDTVDKTLRELAESGLDHNKLNAIINSLEFSTKERSFGGLRYGMQAMGSWLYGGDPAEALSTDSTFAALRKGVDEGLFENLLKDVILGSNHHASICLLPSKTLGAERAESRRKKLAALKASWSEEKIQSVIADFKKLREKQEHVETPEELSVMPQLKLSDIPKEAKPLKNSVGELSGNVLLHQDVETDGIAYLTLHFDLSDFTVEELKLATLAGSVLGEMATEKSSAADIMAKIESVIGRFTVLTNAFYNSKEGVKPVMSVSAALLESRKEEASELIKEILLLTSFEDKDAFYNLLRQSRIILEQRTSGSRNAANIRAASVLSPKSAVDEEIRGISYLRLLQHAEKSFEKEGVYLCEKLSALLKKIFVRERLTISVTGPVDEGWIMSIVSALPHGVIGEKEQYHAAENHINEGFKIAAGVGYSARCGNLRDVGADYSGSAEVAANLLSYDYLWNEVRVKGGAYGTSMHVFDDGEVQFSSFRDPRCSQSLDTFSAAGSALRRFCDSGEAPDKYIISTIGSLEKPIMPMGEDARAAAMYFGNLTEDDLKKERSEVLGTTVEQLREFSGVLDRLAGKSNVCVIGGENIIEACGEKLAKVETLQQ